MFKECTFVGGFNVVLALPQVSERSNQKWKSNMIGVCGIFGFLIIQFLPSHLSV